MTPANSAWHGHQYQPVEQRATRATVMLKAQLLALVLGSQLSLWRLFGGQGLEENGVYMTAAALYGSAYTLAYVACIVFFCMWTYRATSNAWALGGKGLETPGFAVGSYFIPFVNLYKPYRAIKDVYTASVPVELLALSGPTEAPAVFGAWWGTWIVSNILSNISMRLSFQQNALGLGTGLVEGMSLLSDLAVGISAVLAIKVVNLVTDQQKESAQALSQARFVAASPTGGPSLPPAP